MDISGTFDYANAYRVQYGSITTEQSYAATSKRYEAYNSATPAGGLVRGGSPIELGIQPVQLLPPGVDMLPGERLPEEAMRAYMDAAGLQAQSLGHDRLAELSNTVRLSDIKLGRVHNTALPANSEAVKEWRASARDFIENFAYEHAGDYRAAADELGITVDGPGWNYQFAHLDGDQSDMSAGKPKMDAERIFFQIASPQEIASFQEKMAPLQEKVDAAFQKAADQVAGSMQRDMDIAAAVPELKRSLANMGLSETEVASLRWSVDGGGKVNVVSEHDRASEIETVINETPRLANLFQISGSGVGAVSTW